MSEVFLTMAMSLDGFITGPDDNAENPAGINRMRLMNWLGGGAEHDAEGVNAFRPKHPNSQLVFDEAMASGHDGVPIFVPTHKPPAETRISGCTT